jgi:hypothetical protein
MGIQINGQTDTISSTDGSLNIGGTVTVQVTGDATGLTGTPNITVGVVTASSAVISGDLTVNGTTTTLDTTLTEVDKLEVGANNTTVGVAITQSGSGDILRLYDSSTQVVTVKDGGSVGIGTDNPTTKLVINGDWVSSTGQLRIKPSSAGQTLSGFTLAGQDNTLLATVYAHSSSNFLAIQTNDASGSIRFSGPSTEHLRITSSGNVGIGTDNPGTELHVQGTNGYAELRLSGNSGSGGSLEYFDSTTKLADIYADSSSNIVFRNTASNTERLRIDSSGRFLYGTGSSGGYALFDNSTTNPKFQFRQTSGESRGAAFIEDRADAFGFDIYISKSRGSGTSVLSSGDQLGKIWFTGADGTNQVAGAGIIASVSGTPGNDNMPTALIFETNSGTTGTTERMRIAKDGKCTFSPAASVIGIEVNANGFNNLFNTFLKSTHS